MSGVNSEPLRGNDVIHDSTQPFLQVSFAVPDKMDWRDHSAYHANHLPLIDAAGYVGFDILERPVVKLAAR